MATQTTGGGSTTSFTNTPQAKDDTFTKNEDYLGISYFDVMLNDLGGNAKILWSIDNGPGSPTDLITQDLGRAESTMGDKSLKGANIWITSDGKVGYDAACLTAAFKAELEALAVGQTAKDSFTYAIRLANGTLSWATVTIEYQGANDAPVAHADINGTDLVVESGVYPANTPNAGDSSASGNVLANDTDVDSGAVLTVKDVNGTTGNVGNAVEGTYGSVTINADGSWTYNLNNADADTQALFQGQSVTEVFNYTVKDEYGATSTSTLTITITGTNDGPVANADSDAAGENETILVDVLANDSDVDTGHVLTVTAASAPAGQGTASVVGNQVQFDPGTDFDYLDDGETATVTVSYTIEDEHGASSSSTVTITVNGVNDAPVTGGNDEASGTEDDASIGGTVPAATDVDVEDLTYHLVAGSVEVDGEAAADGVVTFNSDGSYSYDPAGDQDLDDGEERVITFRYVANDGTADSDEATVTITVNGVNDAPVTGGNDEASGTEDDASIGGTVPAATDVDVEDLTYHLVAGSVEVDGEAAADGVVTFNSDGSYSYDPAGDQDLDDGEERVITFRYVANDGTADSDEATVTITVNGVNDAPVTGGNDEASGTEDDASIGGTVPAATDVDVEDLTYHLVAGSVEVDGEAAADGVVTFNSDGSYSYDPAGDQDLDDGEERVITFRYVANDGTADSDEATVTITVNGVNDAPVTGGNDEASGTEDDASIGGTVPAATDVDVEDLTYHLVAGSVEVDGEAAADGVVTFNSDGSYSYDPAGDQDLDDGEERVITFRYVANDGTADSDEATVTITVNGVNDAPVTGGNDEASGTEDDASIGGTVPAATDVDVEDLTYHLVAGSVEVDGEAAADGVVTFNSDGSYSYDPAGDQDLDDGEERVITFRYVANDGTADSDEATVTITVNGADDQPTLADPTDGSIAEIDQSSSTNTSGLSGTLTGADVDVETLVYGVVGGSGDLSHAGYDISRNGGYGTLYVNSATGAYLYVPLDAAIEGLDSGDVITGETFTMTVSDGDGALVTQTYKVNISGADDQPTLAPVTSGSVAEVANSTSTIDSGLTGNLVGSDVDHFEPLTYGIQGGTVAAGFSTLVGTYGTLSVNISTGAYTYTKNTAAIEALNAGQNPSDVFTMTVSDGDAPLGTQTYTVNITGANDNVAPTANIDVWVLSDTTALPANTITPAWFLNNDSDPDSPTLFVTAVTGLPAGMVANFDGSGHLTSITGTTPAVGSYNLSYTVSDGSNTATSTVTMTVLDTTTGNPPDSITLNGNDFSYLDLLTGNDTATGDLVLTGNAGKDIFVGSNGDDTLSGGAGDDRLDGGQNNDTLNGGLGNDVLTGGANTDTFIFNAPLAAANADSITDYAAGEIIDITAILSVTTATNVVTGGYLRLTTTGLLQVDLDGGGNDWVTVSSVNLGVNTTVRYDLSDGATNNVVLTPVAPPIALDLDGDGQVSFLATDAGAHFDYGGGSVATAWVAGNDGLLVRDANHDGKISADEIVFATSGSDLEGLARYDSNGDGQLSSADAGFGDFGVWQDADSDGQVDAGELQSLTAHSIAGISLSSDGVAYSAAGGDVQVVGTGSFTRTDGSTGVLADAVFATGGRADDELRAVAASGNNAALLAAVAAAGLATSAAAAAQPGDGQGGAGDGSQPEQSAPLTPEEPGSVSGQDAVAPAPAEAAPIDSAASAAAETLGARAEANHSLIGSETVERADAPAAAQASDSGGHEATLAAPPMVALPSAELLAAALGDGATGQELGAKMLSAVAEALNADNQGQAIDAILDAALPAHADGAHSFAAVMTGHASDMPLVSLALDHGMMQHMALAHPDAMPPA